MVFPKRRKVKCTKTFICEKLEKNNINKSCALSEAQWHTVAVADFSFMSPVHGVAIPSQASFIPRLRVMELSLSIGQR